MNSMLKRSLWLIALTLCFVIGANAQTNTFKGVVVDFADPCNPVAKPGTTITVYVTGTTTTPTGIKDRYGVDIPLTSGEVRMTSDTGSGYFEFRGPNATYDLKFGGLGNAVYTWTYNVSGFYNVKTDFGAKGDGSSDDTPAIRSAAYYIATRNGGTLYFPQGDYVATTDSNGIRIPSGMTIEGSNGDVNSNCRIRVTGANQSLFKISGCTRGVKMTKIKLWVDTTGNPPAYPNGTIAINMVGQYPESTQGLLFTHMTIVGFAKGISVEGDNTTTGYQWEVSSVKVDRVQITGAQYAMYINSGNAGPWQVSNCQIGALTGKYGIFLRRMGFWLIENTMGGGPPNLVEYTEATNADTFILVGSFGNLTLLNDQSEAFNYSVRIVGNIDTYEPADYGGFKYPINVINCIFGDKFQIGADVYVNFSGNIFNSNTVRVVGSTHPKIFSMGDYITNVTALNKWCGPNPPTGATVETVAANCRREFDLGGTGRLIFRTGNTINETTSTFVGQDPVLASGAAPARFNIFLDSDEGGNPALRLGTKRGVGRPTGTPLHSELDFYYDITRSISGGSAGFLTFTGNQTDPNTGLPAYVGYEFNKGNITFGTANSITLGTTTFANLGAPANGTLFYCSDCTQAATCAGSGSGAIAKRIAGGWQCN